MDVVLASKSSSSTSKSFSLVSYLLLLMMIESIVVQDKYWCFEMVAVFMKIVLT